MVWGHRTRSNRPLPSMVRGKDLRVGFRHQPKTYKLVFDDPELEGLEVRCRSMSIGELHDDDMRLYESFAKALISWNLEDENGKALPVTLDAIRSYPDLDFMTSLATTWLNAVTGVDVELGKDSSSGGTFPEASIPMETLSPNPAS